jgi:hypothetical protein
VANAATWALTERTAGGCGCQSVAWASLNSAVSRPFPRSDSGRIAVKMINHYGDEILKVYGV